MMEASFIWIIKLILAHLLTDFLLQPRSWVDARNSRHFATPWLYVHGLVTVAVAGMLINWQPWWVLLLIGGTHILIDGWKSYRPERLVYFLVDQVLHVLVLLLCWYIVFYTPEDVMAVWRDINAVPAIWIVAAALLFLSFPAGIMIGLFTKRWREQISDSKGLEDAGKWIGILERVIILVLVLLNQYSAIGLLIAAKSILRFSESDRQEAKTEYVLIGSLISIATAIGTGMIARYLILVTTV